MRRDRLGPVAHVSNEVHMDRLIRERECKEITGLCRTTRWRLERLGTFPRRRKISENAVGWLASELEEWLGNRRQVTGAEAAAE